MFRQRAVELVKRRWAHNHFVHLLNKDVIYSHTQTTYTYNNSKYPLNTVSKGLQARYCKTAIQQYRNPSPAAPDAKHAESSKSEQPPLHSYILTKPIPGRPRQKGDLSSA